MKYLLDSHTLLWFLFTPEKLSPNAKLIISDSQNDIIISYVSFWEISLKYAMGKFDLKKITPSEIPDECRKATFSILPLQERDVSTFYKLAHSEHKDPFDRMLVWQCLRHKLILLSKDRALNVYCEHGLKVEW